MQPKYKVKVKTIQKPRGSTIVDEEVAMIIREIDIDGKKLEIPHPISSYIIDMYRKINTQRANANVVCGLLNFIQNEIHDGNTDFLDLKQRGLKGLKWKHAAQYLNYSGHICGNSYDTVSHKRKLIVSFYRYLIENKILDEDVKINIVTKVNERTGLLVEQVDNPFKYSTENKIHMPDKVSGTPDKLKDLDVKLWTTLLDICKKTQPDIALGIYFQIMGGLRVGEIVNLTLDSIDLDIEKEEILLDIRDMSNELFKGRDVRLDASKPKRIRSNQIVLNPYGDLIDLYNEHIKIISDIKKQTNATHTNALFINTKGLPMTGNNYMDRFYKVKREFLNYLEKHSYSDYYELKNRKWGTHIGRGIFTNFIINNGLADAPNGVIVERFVADLRGDISVQSSKEYIEKSTLIKNVRLKTNTLRTTLENIKEND